MKYYQKSFVLVSFVIAVCIGSCEWRDWSTDPPPPESIAATNKIRKERGVRQIKETWTFYGRRSGKETWKDETGWGCKNVHYDKDYDEIRAESDYYYSGRTFPGWERDGHMIRERLYISYFYGAGRFAITVTTDNKEIESMVEGLGDMMKFPTKYGSYVGYGEMGKTNKETLEVADKILKMWGLERL